MSDTATELNFDEKVAEGLVLVDFKAAWCGPCRMLAPTLDKIESEVEQLKVVTVDVDEESELARRFTIMSIPTMILFDNGEPVKTIVGVKPKKQLLDDLEKFL